MTGSQRDSWTISVVRTGGFAGLKREWHIRSTDAPEVDWATLVDACSWNAVPASTPSPDSFVWRIEASRKNCNHKATLADANLTGPWRELVDRVKSTG